jgi:hypothetical protein
MSNIESALNKDLERIAKWTRRKRFKISAGKSQVTYFTPWNREKDNLQIFYQGVQIPVEGTMKVLGTDCDSLHTYLPHLKGSGSKGCKRISIVKAAMGPDWGFSLEDGLLTYKALIAPVLGYGAQSSCQLGPNYSIWSLYNLSKKPAFGQSQAATQQLQSSTCMTSAR